MTINWHVLVEENRTHTHLVGEAVGALGMGTVEADRLVLYISEPVDGGRDGAEALAEELARTFVPDWMATGDRPGDAPQRTAYLTTGGGWVISLKHHRGSQYCVARITPARLMHQNDEVRVPRDARASRQSADGAEPAESRNPLMRGFRRLVSGGTGAGADAEPAPQPAQG
ncbi:hypothetical protein LG634_13345 [Streptomyces bambusae]|uniref:hypothetical protein n=1 Tax=Streptomyces bambusae TaxID=1550616 RepID=UPI001CFCC271|nr:hypothetical protein [Streptomyces bambusae]MCB5165815.1 hypothetical protein [Streptomyces bambusae]